MSRDELMARTRELEALLAARDATLAEQAAKIAELALTVDEQKSLIGQLQRMLFGPKSEKMTEEEAAELAAVVGDLTDQTQRPVADIADLLEEQAPQGSSETQQETPRPRKPRTRQIPVNLEVQTTVLEPTDPPCAQCGRMGEEIGREVSEQVDLIPAKLILRRTVRIKRRCRPSIRLCRTARPFGPTQQLAGGRPRIA